MIKVEPLLNDFMKLVSAGEVEVYNEFSLQHELGIFLREKLPNYKVQFERNTRFFGIKGTVKHEIDIVIYNDKERYAIELKQPRNGQHPEQMFCFCCDIKFMEQLKEAGFDGTYCLTLVEDEKFYSGRETGGIYGFFRGSTPIHGRIVERVNHKNREKREISISGTYHVKWVSAGEYGMFYIISL